MLVHLVLRVFKAAPKGEENLASSSVITIQLYATALSAALVGVVVNNSGLISPGGLVRLNKHLYGYLLCLLLAHSWQQF